MRIHVWGWRALLLLFGILAFFIALLILFVKLVILLLPLIVILIVFFIILNFLKVFKFTVKSGKKSKKKKDFIDVEFEVKK